MNPILHAILFYMTSYLLFVGLCVTIALATGGYAESYLDRIKVGVVGALLFTAALLVALGFCSVTIWLVTHA